MRRVRSRAAARYGLLPTLILAVAAVAACGSDTSHSASRDAQPPGSSPASASSSAAAAPCRGSANSPHAALVVQPSKSKVITRCVAIDGQQASAISLLRDSGIELQTKDFGGKLGLAPCQVAHVPAHYSKCFSDGGRYWALFVSRGGKDWTAASKGLSHVTVHPGDSLGLRYDSQQAKKAAPPTAPPLS